MFFLDLIQHLFPNLNIYLFPLPKQNTARKGGLQGERKAKAHPSTFSRSSSNLVFFYPPPLLYLLFPENSSALRSIFYDLTDSAVEGRNELFIPLYLAAHS